MTTPLTWRGKSALIEPRGIETKFFDNNNVYVSSALIEPRGIETFCRATWQNVCGKL